LDIQTKYRLIENVPIIKWPALLQYWPTIVTAIAEVITENKFKPYTASYTHPDGTFLSSNYWKDWKNKKEEFPFSQAVKFLELLKQKEGFRVAITQFNNNDSSYMKWLNPDNLDILGNRLYGFYDVLRPILIKSSEKPYRLKVKYSTTGSKI